MQRKMIPGVESLETKALLSHFAGSVTAHHHQLANIKQANARVESELDIRLTTDKSSYTVGQNVQMSLTATNRTRRNVTVWVGPNTNVFSITQNGKVIWRSNSGPQPLRPTVRRVIRPGQSLTLTANWTATVTGMFVVHNQLAAHGPTAAFSVAASQPAPLPPVSPPIGSELNISLTTDQLSYKVGQVVQMTMTATNETDHDVTVWVGPNTNIFTITQNGQVVWQSNSGPQPLYATAAYILSPGQFLTLKAAWTATAPGTFIVSNDIAPQGPTVMFSVTANQPVPGPVPPVSPPVETGLSISLTTDQPSYKVGQVVHMSMMATNDTDGDVTVWVGPNTNVFTITEDGQIVWQSNSGPPSLRPTVRKTLQPGQWLTLTADWTATKTGTFVLSNSIDPQGPVATFSVTASQAASIV